MTEESKLPGAIGCVLSLIGLTVAAYVLGVIVTCSRDYASIVNFAGVLVGVVLGALAGAGIGTLGPQISKRYRTKAEIAPLPVSACFSRTAGLQRKYTGTTEDNIEKQQIRPIVAISLLGIVFAAGLISAGIKYDALHPDEKGRTQKNAEPATIARPTGPHAPSGGGGGQPLPRAPVLGSLLVEHFHERGYEFGWYGGSANNGDTNKFMFFKVTDIVLDGDHLKICYDWQHGVLSGTLTGNTFRGTIRQDNASGGSVELVFDHDMSAAKGWWRRTNDRTKYRAMVRTSGR